MRLRSAVIVGIYFFVVFDLIALVYAIEVHMAGH